MNQDNYISRDDPREVSGGNDTPLMPCGCDDGMVEEAYLVGDGQPGVTCRIEREWKECPWCGGSGILEDPEYQHLHS